MIFDAHKRRVESFASRDLEVVASRHDGSAKAHCDGIVAFSQTDFTEDLKKVKVPALVMRSEDNQIAPYADSGPLSAKLLKISADLRALVRGWNLRGGPGDCDPHRHRGAPQ